MTQFEYFVFILFWLWQCCVVNVLCNLINRRNYVVLMVAIHEQALIFRDKRQDYIVQPIN